MKAGAISAAALGPFLIKALLKRDENFPEAVGQTIATLRTSTPFE